MRSTKRRAQLKCVHTSRLPLELRGLDLSRGPPEWEKMNILDVWKLALISSEICRSAAANIQSSTSSFLPREIPLHVFVRVVKCFEVIYLWWALGKTSGWENIFPCWRDYMLTTLHKMTVISWKWEALGCIYVKPILMLNNAAPALITVISPETAAVNESDDSREEV